MGCIIVQNSPRTGVFGGLQKIQANQSACLRFISLCVTTLGPEKKLASWLGYPCKFALLIMELSIRHKHKFNKWAPFSKSSHELPFQCPKISKNAICRSRGGRWCQHIPSKERTVAPANVDFIWTRSSPNRSGTLVLMDQLRVHRCGVGKEVGLHPGPSHTVSSQFSSKCCGSCALAKQSFWLARITKDTSVKVSVFHFLLSFLLVCFSWFWFQTVGCSLNS